MGLSHVLLGKPFLSNGDRDNSSPTSAPATPADAAKKLCRSAGVTIASLPTPRTPGAQTSCVITRGPGTIPRLRRQKAENTGRPPGEDERLRLCGHPRDQSCATMVRCGVRCDVLTAVPAPGSTRPMDAPHGRSLSGRSGASHRVLFAGIATVSAPCAATPKRRAAWCVVAYTSSFDLRRLAADGWHSQLRPRVWRQLEALRLCGWPPIPPCAERNNSFRCVGGYRETRRHRRRRREAGGSGASVSSRRTPSCRPCS